MKNMKKIVALLVAVLMLMSSVSAFAEDPVNNLTQDTTLTISNLGKGDTVKYYQVIEWKDNTGWDFTDNFANVANAKDNEEYVIGASTEEKANNTINKDVLKYIIGAPATVKQQNGAVVVDTQAVKGRINSKLAAEIAKIAKSLTDDKIAYTDLNISSTTSSYTVPTGKAGLYIALVDAGQTGVIYNPIFVAADYEQKTPIEYGEGGQNHTNFDNAWSITENTTYSDNALAKKSTINLTKEVTDLDPGATQQTTAATADVGEIVQFTVKTIMPEYAQSYTAAHFKVSDTLSTGLEMVVDASHPVKVFVAPKSEDGINVATATPLHSVTTTSASTKTDTVTVTPATAGLTVDFDTKYILGREDNQDVVITYYAKVTTAALGHNVDQTQNKVTVEYSNNPTDDSSYGILKDITNHYTFSIDALLKGESSGGYETSELIKIGVDKDGNIINEEKKHSYDNGVQTGPLEGAVFALMTSNTPANVEALVGKNKTQLETAFAGDTANHAHIYTNAQYPNGAIFTSNSIGKLNIQGLDFGTYYLVETLAPAGFIRDTRVRTITISGNFAEKTVKEKVEGIEITYSAKVLTDYKIAVNDGTTTYESTYTMTYNTPTYESGTTDIAVSGQGYKLFELTNSSSKKSGTTTEKEAADNSDLIVNTQGTALPSTGGMGTTILYIGGSILVILAAVLLITKRRMNAED